ncbi:DUF3347 domain-containing protein [Mucilaginibacter aquaedulcis]|uniref:DUF3347 domain-containing protein n=1 Tax=Mucilaginibacter aquaedulcis TaxID=1187081 RepID=UPI0025B33434|nr:DUF3347 domain-containing protein [Mucilaginibacter aquaedulcis]MDN3547064.1 DUF3347 domain-containing protein [Mucilaginibacter aquaedulcis]
MKIINFAALFGLVIAASACNQNAKPANDTEVKADSGKAVVTHMADTSNTADVLNTYLDLKNYFLTSKVADIQSKAALLETKLKGIQGCTETAAVAGQIAASKDVKVQRAAFLILSKDVIALVKGAKFKSAPVYIDYCPMADGGKGGYWLSANKAIENPYFPEQMKECGQVKGQIN